VGHSAEQWRNVFEQAELKPFLGSLGCMTVAGWPWEEISSHATQERAFLTEGLCFPSRTPKDMAGGAKRRGEEGGGPSAAELSTV
jgi:hypothetical protein